MPKVLHVDLSGSMTAPGTLIRPAGSYRSAVNAVIEEPGVLRKRPGFNTTATSTGSTQIPTGYTHTVRGITDRYALVTTNGTTLPTDAIQADTVRLYKKQLGTATGTLTTPLVDPPDYPTPIELYRPIDASFPVGRQTAATLGNSSFFTTGVGVQKIDFESSGTIIRRPAGIPKAIQIDTRNVTEVNIGSGFLPTGYAVAYRVLWFYQLPDKRRIYGSPTARLVHWNDVGAACDLQMQISVPGALNDTSTYLTHSTGTLGKYGAQLYRSRASNLAAGTWPDDELFLVNELYLTFTGAGYPINPTVVDNTPDDDNFLGLPLYTNGSQEGLFRANDPPENFIHIEEWRNRLWGANYYTRHALELTMFSRPSNAETITIDSVTFTFVYSAPATAFEVDAAPFVGSGIALRQYFVMQNLAQAVNQNCPNVYAYVTTIPGGQTLSSAGITIRIEHRKLTTYTTGYSFQVTFGSAAAAARFRPYNPASGSYALNSNGTTVTNTVLCSKYGQPDAFPPDDLTTFQLGDNNLTVLGMSALEEGLYVFTTSGLFLISGRSESSFAADLIDETVRLVGSECMTRADGAIWAWTTQGFARIKNGRVEYVSGPIQDQLDKAVELLYQKSCTIGPFSTIKKSSYAFCASHTQKRRVYLFLPNSANFT